MLDELKQNYKNVAAHIKDWKTRPQIELANLYHEDEKNRDVYLSALVVRYWNIFAKSAYQGKDVFPPEEAYDWYIESVMKVLEERPWLNEKSTLYEDEKAFEKAVNVRFFCTKMNWFQASNRYRRKINHSIISLDKITEDYADAALPVDLTYDISSGGDFKELVAETFNKKLYLLSLILDVIAHDINVNSIENDEHLVRCIKKSIRRIPDKYSITFADEYNLDSYEVKCSFEAIQQMSDARLYSSILSYIYKLRSLLSKEV